MTINENQNTNTNREYKIYIRSTQEWVPVTEEVYRAPGEVDSLDAPVLDKHGNERSQYEKLRDDSPDAQSIVEDKELLAALREKLLELDPDGRRICELLMEGKTERDIASVMGFASQSSVSHRKRKAFDQLRTLLRDYI